MGKGPLCLSLASQGTCWVWRSFCNCGPLLGANLIPSGIVKLIFNTGQAGTSQVLPFGGHIAVRVGKTQDCGQPV